MVRACQAEAVDFHELERRQLACVGPSPGVTDELHHRRRFTSAWHPGDVHALAQILALLAWIQRGGHWRESSTGNLQDEGNSSII